MATTTKRDLTQEINLILGKINGIVRNQIFIDGALLLQGINFVFHPQEAPHYIMRSLALAVFFLALFILIGFILSKSFNKTNSKSIILASFFLILAAIVYFTSHYYAYLFQYAIAIIFIVSGIIKLLGLYRVVRLNHAKPKTQKTSASIGQEIEGTVTNNITTGVKRMLAPLIAISAKLNKFHHGQVIINLVLIITGIVMLFFRFRTNEILIRVSGGILIFCAIADLIALLWTHHESAFVRKITHNS